MKKKVWIALCLCLVLVCTAALSACKGAEGATQDEVSTSSATSAVQTSTAIVTTATVNDTKAATTASEDAQQTETDSDNGNSSDNVLSGAPADRVENTKTSTVNVGGKDYKVTVGDSITYTCYLTTPKAIENIQASLSYDDTVLKLVKSSSKEMFPTLSGTIYNTNLSGGVLFNASEPMEGYDFTAKQVLVQLKFQVIKDGYTSIATAIEFMDEIGGEAYVSNYKITGDITVSEALS
ncbi:MAG: hypothetical protein IJ298_01065 [Ruminococcus sp.]|nr:hypothetical protein [Ruminococcus sp.]